MANVVDRYRRGASHYADVECAHAKFERYVVLIARATSATTNYLQ